MEFLNKDNIVLPATYMKAAQEDAIVLLIHGIGEHHKRFEHVGKMLNENNISLISYDQRGHGKNVGKRGYARLEDLSNDIISVLTQIKLISNKPIYLYGHSMGGGVCIYTTLTSDLPIKGLIITSPWLKLFIKIPKFIKNILINHPKLLGEITIPNGIAATLLSKDEDVGKRYVEDTLTHNKIALSLYGDMERAAAYSLTHAQDMKVPMLLVHGSADKICDVEGSREFSDNCESCTFVEVENAYHEIHNEQNEKDLLFDLVISFIQNDGKLDI